MSHVVYILMMMMMRIQSLIHSIIWASDKKKEPKCDARAQIMGKMCDCDGDDDDNACCYEKYQWIPRKCDEFIKRL